MQYSPGHEKGTGRSPFESAMGHTPDVTQDGYNVQPFGCPISYKPGHRHMYVNESGMRSKTNAVLWDGWFVGMDWPKCLIWDRIKNAIVTASRHHIVFYNGIYTLPPHENPLTAAYLSFAKGPTQATEDEILTAATEMSQISTHDPSSIMEGGPKAPKVRDMLPRTTVSVTWKWKT